MVAGDGSHALPFSICVVGDRDRRGGYHPPAVIGTIYGINERPLFTEHITPKSTATQ